MFENRSSFLPYPLAKESSFSYSFDCFNVKGQEFTSCLSVDSTPCSNNICDNEFDLLEKLQYASSKGNERHIIFATPNGSPKEIFSSDGHGGRYQTKPSLFRGARISFKIEKVDSEGKYHKMIVAEKNFAKLCGLFSLVCSCEGKTLEDKLHRFKYLPKLTNADKKALADYSPKTDWNDIILQITEATKQSDLLLDEKPIRGFNDTKPIQSILLPPSDLCLGFNLQDTWNDEPYEISIPEATNTFVTETVSLVGFLPMFYLTMSTSKYTRVKSIAIPGTIAIGISSFVAMKYVKNHAIIQNIQTRQKSTFSCVVNMYNEIKKIGEKKQHKYRYYLRHLYQCPFSKTK